MKKLFKDKKVLIMGLGLHGGGAGVAKFFVSQGAKVTVTDLKTKKQLKDSIDKLKGLNIKYVLGGHKESDFLNADLIVKNPDVPNNSKYLEIARKNNIEIETDVSLFMNLSKDAYVIGITGSKGKTTTATLLYNILKSKYPRVFLAGNIGKSPLELKLEKGDKVVLELSSFELENVRRSPQLAVITNILADHLNRYGSMNDYIEAKKNIFKFQDKNDILILNKDDLVLREFAKEAKSKVLYFSKLKDFKLSGVYNEYNVSAAIEAAKQLKVPLGNIKKVVKDFKGVPNRQEFVRECNGVKYFNDTTATMPNAAIYALETFNSIFANKKIVLIAGGQDKNLDYKQFAEAIKRYVFKLVLLPGTATEKIKRELNEYVEANSMEKAVKIASKAGGDIVILSPAAASFNLFKNEFDRGDKFKLYVKKIICN